VFPSSFRNYIGWIHFATNEGLNWLRTLVSQKGKRLDEFRKWIYECKNRLQASKSEQNRNKLRLYAKRIKPKSAFQTQPWILPKIHPTIHRDPINPTHTQPAIQPRSFRIQPKVWFRIFGAQTGPGINPRSTFEPIRDQLGLNPWSNMEIDPGSSWRFSSDPILKVVRNHASYQETQDRPCLESSQRSIQTRS